MTAIVRIDTTASAHFRATLLLCSMTCSASCSEASATNEKTPVEDARGTRDASKPIDSGSAKGADSAGNGRSSQDAGRLKDGSPMKDAATNPKDGASKPDAAARDSARPSGPSLVITAGSSTFERSVPEAAPTGATFDVVVDGRQELHTIDAFGGAFNEQGWTALSVLNEDERDAVLAAIFDPTDGLRFNLCRTPIGASDYADSRYTLDETSGDYEMKDFSIARDEKKLIPYIKAAMTHRPDLKLWGSAWTPPTWMKSNGAFDSGDMKDTPDVYRAYALYLAKFVESYRAAGLDVTMVVPQNEPGQLTNYPSCNWTPEQYTTFIRDYAGPLFKQRQVGASIWVGTINTEASNFDVRRILTDADAAEFIEGVAFQWNGLSQVASTRVAHPNLPIMQSETECGNNYWQAAYNPDRPPNDFAYGAYTWRKFREFIQAGSSSYMLWNMILDEEGKNIDSKSPWPQNAAVVVDKTSKEVVYTPMFWATKHFSGLVDIGAHVLSSTGTYADRIAFRNPDGSVVVELLNTRSTETTVRVSLPAGGYVVNLPAESFATLIVPVTKT